MINNELIERFFNHDVTEAENAELAAWLDEDPTHQAQFQESLDLYLLTRTLDAEVAFEATRREQNRRKPRLIRIAAWTVGMAASVALAVLVTWKQAVGPRNQLMARTTSITAAPGHQSALELSDGTKVLLNSGTTLSYPAVFGKTREVQVDGEAFFDVAKDSKHPFVVHTYRYHVTVTGTRFNLLASRKNNEFTTSLLEGSVFVTDDMTPAKVLLKPGQSVTAAQDGSLHLRTEKEIENRALWTKGIISYEGESFDALMRKFERAFGVRIVIGRKDLPEIHYSRMKVWVSDGITDALDLLKGGADFTYEYDNISNTYYIK